MTPPLVILPGQTSITNVYLVAKQFLLVQLKAWNANAATLRLIRGMVASILTTIMPHAYLRLKTTKNDLPRKSVTATDSHQHFGQAPTTHGYDGLGPANVPVRCTEPPQPFGYYERNRNRHALA